MRKIVRVGIYKNKDEVFYEKISNAVRKNDNYCPCVLGSRGKDEYRCMCEQFLKQEDGMCHCKRYEKKKVIYEVSDTYELRDGEKFLEE